MALAESPALSAANPGSVRHDWTRAEVRALFELPFPELMFEAARIHRMHFDPAEVKPHYMTAGHNTRAMQSAAAE